MENERPPIGSIVQSRNGSGWDYTGEVIEHHPDHSTWFKVAWHKWANKDDKPDITDWQYDMRDSRLVTRQPPGQWWPRK